MGWKPVGGLVKADRVTTTKSSSAEPSIFALQMAIMYRFTADYRRLNTQNKKPCWFLSKMIGAIDPIGTVYRFL